MIKGRNDNIKKSAIKEDNKEVSNIHGLLGSGKSVQQFHKKVYTKAKEIVKLT